MVFSRTAILGSNFTGSYKKRAGVSLLESSPTNLKFADFPHLEKSPQYTLPPLNDNCHVITHKTSFLVVAIASVPFLISVFLYTGHANFDFTNVPYSDSQVPANW